MSSPRDVLIDFVLNSGVSVHPYVRAYFSPQKVYHISF